jgi:hypothetical protein
MTRDPREAGAYVRRVQEGTQRYAHDLLAEHERLLGLVATLQARVAELEARAQDDEERLRASEALEARAGLLESENLRLREQLQRHLREQAHVQAQLETIREESRRYSMQYAEVEQQNSNLANLYVASYRLHGTLDRDEVLQTIQEILANLIGSEEIAVFEREGATLSLVASCGIDPSSCRRVPVGAGVIGRAVETGRVHVVAEPAVRHGGDLESRLTACIPLTLGDRVIGAIAIFRLLPQKTAIEALDHELFDLLATHAATALYCTGLEARLTAGART